MAPARGTSRAAAGLLCAALVLVSLPHVASWSQQDPTAASSSSSEATPSSSTDFSFVKGLLAASAVARAAKADGSEGLLDGLARAGTRRLAGSAAADAEAEEAAKAAAAAGGTEATGAAAGGGGNLLGNALLLNRLRANIRDDGAEVRASSIHGARGWGRLRYPCKNKK